MRFNGWTLLIIANLALGCVEKGKPVNNHDGARRTPEQSPLDPPVTGPPSAEATQATDRFTKAKDPLVEVVLPLAQQVLSADRIRDPKSLFSRAVQDELNSLNAMILNLKASDFTRTEYHRLARLYTAGLLTDCSEFRDSCTGLRYYKLSPASSQVVKRFASQSRDNRVRMLLIAIELKNKLWDSELVELLLSTATEQLSTDEAKDIAKAQSLLALALIDAANRIQDKAEARRFLDSMKGWGLLNQTTLILDESGRQALFELAAKGDYLHGDNGGIHPGLTALMEILKKNPASVFAKQALLNKQKLFLPAAVGAKAISQYDELYFLLDSVFTLEVQPNSAATMVKSLNRTSAQLREAVENYLRIQFLATLYEGSKMAGEVFTAPIEAEGLLRHALNETGSVRRVWHAFTARAAPLRTFAVLASNGGDPADQAKIRSAFDTLDHSISQIATYPHMMVLFHILSKKRFDLYIPMVGKSINSADLMRWLFEGRLPPLFPYTDDERQLNHFELLHSFDFAVRTSIFETVHIDVDDFISDTMGRLTEKQIKDIDTTMDRVRTRMTETLEMRDLKSICTEFSGEPKRSRQFYFYDVRQSPNYGRMGWKIYESMSSKSTDTEHSSTDPGTIGRESMGLFYADATFNEALEITRLDLGTTFRLGEAMLASYRDYLTKYKLPSLGFMGTQLTEEVNKRTAKTRAALSKLRNKRAQTLVFASSLYKELGPCYLQAALADRSIMEQALEYERIYLRHIHQTLVKAHSAGITPQERERLHKSIAMQGLPGGFTGRDRLNDNGFGATQVDLLIRISQYMMHGLKVDGRELPPLAPHLKIQFGERLDVDLPFVRDTENGFVPFVENQEQFVSSAFRLYFRSRGAFLFWKSLISYPVTASSDLFKNNVSTFRLDYELTGKSTTVDVTSFFRDYE